MIADDDGPSAIGDSGLRRENGVSARPSSPRASRPTPRPGSSKASAAMSRKGFCSLGPSHPTRSCSASARPEPLEPPIRGLAWYPSTEHRGPGPLKDK
jgi:hypothetical protein